MFRWWSHLVLFSVVCLAPGCRTEITDPATSLGKATALKVKYTVGEQVKLATIDDPSTVRGILSALKIDGSRKGAFAAVVPRGTVDFIMPDTSVVHAIFVEADDLEVEGFGQVFIDREFYKQICELISAHESRQIDVLQSN
jgi:hypothetical protein